MGPTASFTSQATTFAAAASIGLLGGLSQCLAAEEAPDRCQGTYKPPHEWELSEVEQQQLTELIRTLCRQARSGELTGKTAYATWSRAVIRYRGCIRSERRPSHVAWLQSKKAPQAVANVWAKFCRDTWDSERNQAAVTAERVKWLYTENFCESTRYAFNPGGFTAALLPDSESLKKVNQQAQALCTDLRRGALSYDDAEFRWQQEVLWAREQFKTEAAKDGLKRLNSVLGFVGDLAGSVVKKALVP